jgi:DNA-directed RNA polymerase
MNLHDHQHELELHSLAEGIRRSADDAEYQQTSGRAGNITANQRVIRGLLPELTQVIRRSLEATKGEVVTVLSEVDHDVLAFVTLWTIFNSVGQDETLRHTCVALGSIVQDHMWTEGLKGQPKFAKVYRRITTKYSDVGQRRAELEKAFGDIERWSSTFRFRLGSFLVNSALKSKIVELRKDDGVDHLDFTSGVLAALSDINAEASWIRAAKLPMVVAPKPWRALDDGGYLTRNLQRMNPLVRTFSRKHRGMVEKAVADGSLRPALEALNTIQATPWRINQRMLEIIERCHEEGIEVDGLPRGTLLVMPKRIEGDTEEARKVRRTRAEVRRRNVTIQGQLVTFRGDIQTAREMIKYDQFWLPHNMDFRGRVYPVPYFNQQRSDYVKAMMEFSEGVPMTTEGYRWLLIHIANCGDFGKVSKRSFDERIAWTEANMARITEVAEDPFKHRWWLDADKPFAFLRAAMELRDCNEAQGAFVSYLPIHVDGSNSGLQHYSAILRSYEDGQYVNLVPQSVPADVYAEVARRVEAIAKVSDEPLAQLWLNHGITRKTVKRNVMTFPYSSEAFGFREQLMEDLMTPLNDDVVDGRIAEHPFGIDGGWAASGWMAKQVFAAVNDTVKAASGAMRFLKTVAGALAHEGHGLTYVTPVGLPVLHEYTEWDCKRVQVWLYDASMRVVEATPHDVVDGEDVYRRISTSLRSRPTKTIVKSKQKSAVAPNVIHSMDAAHLMLTTLKANQLGVPSFSLIHDSFGCHATHMPILFATVRSEMVAMYTNYDPLDVIKRSADLVLSEKGRKKIETVPEKGSLDLNLINNSEYAFA